MNLSDRFLFFLRSLHGLRYPLIAFIDRFFITIPRLEHPLYNYGTICARKGNALNELRANQKSDQQQKSPLQSGMTVTCNVVPLAFVVITNFLRGVNCSSISGTCLGAWKTGFGPNTDRSDKPTPFATLNTIIIFNLFSNV